MNNSHIMFKTYKAASCLLQQWQLLGRVRHCNTLCFAVYCGGGVRAVSRSDLHLWKEPSSCEDEVEQRVLRFAACYDLLFP